MVKNLMVSCQKGPTRHAYAWQIGPFWQDTLEMKYKLKKRFREIWSTLQTFSVKKSFWIEHKPKDPQLGGIW